MKNLIKWIIAVCTLVTLWFIATDIGIDLVGLLWRTDMKFEALLVGFLAWDFVLGFFLKLFVSVAQDIEEVNNSK